MIERTFDSGRWIATFRPRGIGRFVQAAFLAFWLCGWAIGEFVALVALLAVLGSWLVPDLVLPLGVPVPRMGPGAGWFVILFLAFWLTLWTVGGMAAIHELLRNLGGEDRIVWDGAGIELHRRVGPFRTVRHWPAETVAGISLARRDRALTLHAVRSTHVLTRWGTIDDRTSVRDEMRRSFQAVPTLPAALPVEWASEPQPEGGTLLFHDRAVRRRQALVAWSVTLGLAAIAIFAGADSWRRGGWGPGEIAATAAAALVLGVFATGSAWLSHGGSELLLRHDALELRRWFLSRRWTRTLEPLRFAVSRSTDSDGDEWDTLSALASDQSHVIERRMNDGESVLRLARWVAERCGAPLDLDRAIEDEERRLSSG